MISLREVTKDNYLDCIHLKLDPEQQKFLAPNSVSIAQSKFISTHRTRAICKDNNVVGFLSFTHEDDPEDLELFWLFRFMIDKEFQAQGISQQVLKLLVEEVKALGGKRLQTMHSPTNMNASSAYKKFGFTEIGVLDDGDIHLELPLK